MLFTRCTHDCVGHDLAEAVCRTPEIEKTKREKKAPAAVRNKVGRAGFEPAKA
jgi:hypothetical protein